MNGNQLAAGYDDGTVIASSYPSGKMFFKIKDPMTVQTIKWNTFDQDVFATQYHVRFAIF